MLDNIGKFMRILIVFGNNGQNSNEFDIFGEWNWFSEKTRNVGGYFKSNATDTSVCSNFNFDTIIIIEDLN